MTLVARYEYPPPREGSLVPLVACEHGEARIEVANDLSRTAAEGRLLPRSVKIYRIAVADALPDDFQPSDEPLLVGSLAPRKGCCSGWELSWCDTTRGLSSGEALESVPL